MISDRTGQAEGGDMSLTVTRSLSLLVLPEAAGFVLGHYPLVVIAEKGDLFYENSQPLF